MNAHKIDSKSSMCKWKTRGITRGANNFFQCLQSNINNVIKTAFPRGHLDPGFYLIAVS